MIEGLAVVVMSTDARGASNAKAKRELAGRHAIRAGAAASRHLLIDQCRRATGAPSGHHTARTARQDGAVAFWAAVSGVPRIAAAARDRPSFRWGRRIVSHTSERYPSTATLLAFVRACPPAV